MEGLNKANAKLIVDAVKSDPAAIAQINSLFRILPAGWAGGTRNFFLMIKDWDAEDEETVKLVCVGIADVTERVINRLIQKNQGNPDYPFVRAETVTTNSRAVYHVATGVKMKNGNTYVFDWHATLDVEDPLIFRTVYDWDLKIGGSTFSNFKGF
jgi:hypothetical protein